MLIRVLPVAVLALLGLQPLAAQASDYDRAVAARLADDPQLAVDLLESWLAERPDDVDARLQYGYALMALGRLDDAERAFSAVLDGAPDYKDAREGLALVAQRRRGTAENAPLGFLFLEGALSDLAAPQSDWKEVGIGLGLPVGDRDRVDLRGNWFERFDLDDVELSGVYTHRASDDVWVRMGASGTPSPNFRPEIGLSTGIDARIASSTVLSFDVSWQDFPTQEVWNFRHGITQYLDGGRYAVSLSARAVAASRDDLLIGGSLRGDYFPQERTRLFIGVSGGPETDIGVVRDTTSFFGGGEVPLSKDLSLLGSISREWRDVGSDRTEFRIGVKLAL